MIQIVIYTLKNCPICQFLKGELEGRGKRFKEVKIEENEDIGDVLEETFGTTTYPIFTLQKENKIIIFLRETNLESPKGVITFDVNDIPNILDQYEI